MVDIIFILCGITVQKRVNFALLMFLLLGCRISTRTSYGCSPSPARLKYQSRSASTLPLCFTLLPRSVASAPTQGHCLPPKVTISHPRSLSPTQEHYFLPRSLSPIQGHYPTQGHYIPSKVFVSHPRALFPPKVTVSHPGALSPTHFYTKHGKTHTQGHACTHRIIKSTRTLAHTHTHLSLIHI